MFQALQSTASQEHILKWIRCDADNRGANDGHHGTTCVNEETL